MAVATSSAGVRTALNRIEPFDPSFVVDFDFSSTGDASAGLNVLTCTFGANEAFIPVFLTGLNGDDSEQELSWTISPGVNVNGVNQAIFGSELGTFVLSQTQFNCELFKVAQTMMIPDLGSSGTMALSVLNANTEVMRLSARAYVWPRNQILGMPCRLFWPYLL